MLEQPSVEAAGEYVLPFGQYKGMTLASVVEVDILYLDWLRGERESDKKKTFDLLDASMVTLLEYYEEEVISELKDRDDGSEDLF